MSVGTTARSGNSPSDDGLCVFFGRFLLCCSASRRWECASWLESARVSWRSAGGSGEGVRDAISRFVTESYIWPMQALCDDQR